MRAKLLHVDKTKHDRKRVQLFWVCKGRNSGYQHVSIGAESRYSKRRKKHINLHVCDGLTAGCAPGNSQQERGLSEWLWPQPQECSCTVLRSEVSVVVQLWWKTLY